MSRRDRPERPSDGGKTDGALRTIGEVSRETGVAPHVLRYWEGRFPQLRPVQRAGNRRYYRPDDIALIRRIDQLLNRQGYTMRGVQQLLEAESRGKDDPAAMLRAIRDSLAEGLAWDDRAER
ncbi:MULTISPECIES: MerR family transcriptional regulator [Sphingomonas]|uniref:MerR family transcriptional regulator n=1 Tax=Sphingomonas zeae TaxID=1646122 RepID=A0A7Y6B681_9SPHN|nr:MULTISPECIES: MerR family transcriptional regulator [Sphingomonas]MDK8185972.1 MerR family transcriptional regulator [Sphingomonas zeae]MDK8215280.1 MerR family transcriptional regulator [Sphingomonas sp. UMB7805-LC452B]NUU47281.1 MerR family transcriptional regulator [Sphingomonas zeae]